MPKASPWASIAVAPPPQHRRRYGVTYTSREFRCQSANCVWTWGSTPGTAELVYVTNDTPVGIGSALRIDIAGHTFWGLCADDKSVVSTQGHRRTLAFQDNRAWLDFDTVKSAFNIPDVTIVGGRRVRRYAHILPRNYYTLTKTWTNYPLSAREIIRYLLSAPTTEDLWTCTYHSDQLYPLPVQFDWLSGSKLRTALQQVADEQGLSFTLMGSPFNLVWARRGEGVLPAFAANSDSRTSGISLTDNPTRIEILGERNIYQVHDIALEQDWARAWERFFDPMLFIEEIYSIGQLSTPLTIGSQSFAAGTTFRTVGAHKVGAVFTDPEQIISRQLAVAAANEITVGQYAALKGDASYLDYRKFAGRSRLDMPAMLYIKELLFRAFRVPAGYSFTNAAGGSVPISALSPANKMIGKVTHDPLTGIMECDLSEGADGNGYAIVKGYQVTQDLFRTIRPERFNLPQWLNNSQNVWEHIEFQVDDSGEGDFYILFDAPVIRSSDLIGMVDGYATIKVHNADGSPIAFTIPDVRVGMSLEAERFSYVYGRGPLDDVQVYPGLNAEYIVEAPSYTAVEVAYADGGFATGKAADLAESLLSRQIVLAKGQSTRPLNPGPDGKFATGTQLTAMMDRIEIGYSAQGTTETVFLTSEYPRQTYTPERDLDRGAAMKQLMPGQAELRHFANIAKLTASALASNPSARRLATDAYQTEFGAGSMPVQVHVAAPVYANIYTFRAGTTFCRRLPTTTDGALRNTSCVIPSESTTATNVFGGVTIRDNETVGADGANLLLRSDGEILAQVKGPVAANDAVGLSPGNGYLVKDGAPVVGRTMQANVTSESALIKVSTTSVAPSTPVVPFQIVRATDTTVRVAPGHLMTGLDVSAKAKIWGLDTEFILHKDELVYIEILFDKNLSPFLFNICRRTSWDVEAYPKMIRSARATDDPHLPIDVGETWVLPFGDAQRATNKALAEEKFAAFDTKLRCWKTFYLIGYATTSTAADSEFSMTDFGTDETFYVIQRANSHLMLAQFCDNGIPALCPIPYHAPIVDVLPAPSLTKIETNLVMDIPGPGYYPGATIYYTYDGTDPTRASLEYTAPLNLQQQPLHIRAFAVLGGYEDSNISDGTFTL